MLATGGEDGKILVYNVADLIEGVPNMCIPCASAELPQDPLTQMVWGPDGQLYTGHSSGGTATAEGWAIANPRKSCFRQ